MQRIRPTQENNIWIDPAITVWYRKRVHEIKDAMASFGIPFMQSVCNMLGDVGEFRLPS
jgi:hypothetical protein